MAGVGRANWKLSSFFPRVPCAAAWWSFLGRPLPWPADGVVLIDAQSDE